MASSRAKMPRAVSAAMSDIGGRRYPRALVVAVAGWLLVAVMLLLCRLGAPDPTDAQQTDAATGVQAVRAPHSDTLWFAPWLPVLGVVVLVLAVALFLGYGWARLVLALAGLIAVVALAATASWLAIPTVVLFVVATIAGVTVSAHRYLTRAREEAPADSAETPRTVS